MAAHYQTDYQKGIQQLVNKESILLKLIHFDCQIY